ncbi:hypothetical protein EMPS_01006 [Entomortierella parvispora]|uniref:Uncharacterized protein n=1 Tax=Entomortierella parvispora TaxID=205924 RepID=A0A9P3H259_9FUNG|nr:hypothetical protein EMPS_01006 [Entomortierella parvispora]
MSLGIIPAIIHQATPSTGNDKGSWATLLLPAYETLSAITVGGSSYQKRSFSQSDGPVEQFINMSLGADGLRPSLRTPQQVIVEISNWLSLVGSIVIILHIPKVIKQVPTQRTRMLIIMFTAISNTGFALANVITDLTSATAYLPCSVSAWCYIFFQLLTCSLVIVSTFRLCGVFLFKQQRPFPTKAIILCPLLAFILASTPAVAGQYAFDPCGHYCWFRLEEVVNCRVRSLWAWFCFYIWMIVFLCILFGSTSFVMIKIAVTVMSSRSALNKVVNAGRDESFVSADLADSPQPPSVSTFERLRSMSQAFTTRTASILSHLSLKHEGHSQAAGQGNQIKNEDIPVSDIRIELTQPEQEMPLAAPSAAHINRMASLGLDSPTLRSEGILAAAVDNASATGIAMPDQTQSLEATRTRSPMQLVPPNNHFDSGGPTPILRSKERPFLLAILRQALYPISISVSGCIQTIVDLTLTTESPNVDAIDYAANIGTSIQGFLFFLVFMFDPAVVQTRQNYRKYLIWKYYVEFYYSLGMPHEGRSFEDAFLQKCRDNLDKPQNVAQFDQLTRPPPYSWSIQYDDLAMPSDFQTAYPLTDSRGRSPSGRTSATAEGRRGSAEGRRGSGPRVGQLNAPFGSSRSNSPSKLRDPPSTIIEDDETPSTTATSLDLSRSGVHDSQDRKSFDFMSRPPITETVARPADYTHLQSIPHPLANEPVPSSSPSTSVESFSASSDPPMSLSIVVPSDATRTKPEGEGQDAEMDTSLTPASPEEPSHLSFVRSGGRATWPRSSAPALNTSISFSSSDGDDIVDAFGISKVSDHSRQYSLRAPQAGDVLTFQKLDRVTTIGGSDLRTPHRIYRPSMASSNSRRRTMATMRGSSKSSSLGNMLNLSSPLRFLSSGPSSNKDQPHVAGGEQNQEYQLQLSDRGVGEQGRYQCHFHFPRMAYLMHQIVRLLYIPREARLPPIPNPFSTVSRSQACEEMDTRTRTPSVRQRQDDEELWLDMVTSPDHGGRVARAE